MPPPRLVPTRWGGGILRRSQNDRRSRQPLLQPFGPQNHRSEGRQPRGTPLPVHAHPHRHQPGHLRPGRNPRWGQRRLCAHAQEPHPRGKPVRRRQDLPAHQAVRRPRPTGRRRLRHRDGPDGPGRQGLRRAGLPAGWREVPRSDPLLLRHTLHTRSRRNGEASQGQNRDGFHLPQDGCRHPAVQGGLGSHIVPLRHARHPRRDAPLYRDPDHGQRNRGPGGVCGCRSRGRGL